MVKLRSQIKKLKILRSFSSTVILRSARDEKWQISSCNIDSFILLIKERKKEIKRKGKTDAKIEGSFVIKK